MNLKFNFQDILSKKRAIVVEGRVDLKEKLRERISDYKTKGLYDVVAKLKPISGKYIEVTLNIKGIVVVPSTRSLVDVEIPVDKEVTETLVDRLSDDEMVDEENDDLPEIVTFVKDDLIDLTDMIIDYIILSVPTQVLSESEKEDNLMPHGEQWQVISEDDLKNKESANKETDSFKKLAELKQKLEEENDK